VSAAPIRLLPFGQGMARGPSRLRVCGSALWRLRWFTSSSRRERAAPSSRPGASARFFGVAAFALVVMNTRVGVFQVSVVLLAGAAPIRLLPLWQGMARGPWRLRVCGSAVRLAPLLQRAAFTACTHQVPGRRRVAGAQLGSRFGGLEVVR